MKIGLIDVDSHNFPNLCLMKLSEYHTRRGDRVEWWSPKGRYDLVYKSRVFTDTYSKDTIVVNNAEKVIQGGTGYGPTAIYNDNLLKRVWDITQRIKLLSLLFFRNHVISNLNLIPLVALIHHKVNLQLLTNTLALFILIEDVHDTHINIVATNQKLVINNVLHDMRRFLLSEIQTGISQSQISKVVFQICTNILSSFNIVSTGFGNQKGICQIVNMVRDGFIGISHLSLTGEGISNL